MRRIYFIRHARPDIPFGERWCVGSRTDFPLGTYGLIQASLLSFEPELKNLDTVFCSSLSRARETALSISPSPVMIPGLEEQDMGEWDGLSFAEIMKGWPELYAARENDPYTLPEGADTYKHMAERFRGAVFRCIAESEGDIAIVAHKSSISTITGSREALGWARVSTAEFDHDMLKVTDIGIQPHPALNDEVCDRMMSAAGADEALRAHCTAVADLACEICRMLEAKGLQPDMSLVRSSALLHDIARAQRDHDAVGAKWLLELGYPDVSEIIRQHHDPDSTQLNEAAIVFIADKCIRGESRVTIEERFAGSADRCRTREAKAAHAARLETALRIKIEINRISGDTVIE